MCDFFQGTLEFKTRGDDLEIDIKDKRLNEQSNWGPFLQKGYRKKLTNEIFWISEKYTRLYMIYSGDICMVNIFLNTCPVT